jgi:hypothetical protein
MILAGCFKRKQILIGAPFEPHRLLLTPPRLRRSAISEAAVTTTVVNDASQADR